MYTERVDRSSNLFKTETGSKSKYFFVFKHYINFLLHNTFALCIFHNNTKASSNFKFNY